MALESTYQSGNQRYCDKPLSEIMTDTYKRAKWYNSNEGRYKELECEICRNKGYILETAMDETGYPYLKAYRCSCLVNNPVQINILTKEAQ